MTEDVSPPKPRPMWMAEGDTGSPEVRKGPKRRTTVANMAVPNDDEETTGNFPLLCIHCNLFLVLCG